MRPGALLSLAVLAGCATVHDEHSVPVFGRAVVEAVSPCQVEFLRGPTPQGQTLGTRQLEGSIFLDAVESERLLQAEACAVGANAVHIAKESYGVPFFGTQVVAVLIRRPAG
jgi:hypothetical protein